MVDCFVLCCLDWSKLFKLFRLAMVLLGFFLMFWLSIAIFSSFSFSLVFKNVFGWVWIVFILFMNCFVWIVLVSFELLLVLLGCFWLCWLLGFFVLFRCCV